MSATDRRLARRRSRLAAARQPGGRTPNCLPSNATKMRAFCSPKPGSVPTAALRSAPSEAPFHTAGRVAVESFDEHLSKRLDALCHRGRESMQGRRRSKQFLERGRVVLGDLLTSRSWPTALLQLVR